MKKIIGLIIIMAMFIISGQGAFAASKNVEVPSKEAPVVTPYSFREEVIDSRTDVYYQEFPWNQPFYDHSEYSYRTISFINGYDLTSIKYVSTNYNDLGDDGMEIRELYQYNYTTY